jgi:hypothetical protein
LIHIDVKKLGRIEPGAGHRVTGQRRSSPRKRNLNCVYRHQTGWEYVHVAIDECTRPDYAEVLRDEKAGAAVIFLKQLVYPGTWRSGVALVSADPEQPPGTRYPFDPADDREAAARTDAARAHAGQILNLRGRNPWLDGLAPPGTRATADDRQRGPPRRLLRRPDRGADEVQ